MIIAWNHYFAHFGTTVHDVPKLHNIVKLDRTLMERFYVRRWNRYALLQTTGSLPETKYVYAQTY